MEFGGWQWIISADCGPAEPPLADETIVGRLRDGWIEANLCDVYTDALKVMACRRFDATRDIEDEILHSCDVASGDRA